MRTFEYKGCHTVIAYDAEDRVYHGKIEGIQDLVNFESDTEEDIETAFREAVDDCMAFCKETGKIPA